MSAGICAKPRARRSLPSGKFRSSPEFSRLRLGQTGAIRFVIFCPMSLQNLAVILGIVGSLLAIFLPIITLIRRIERVNVVREREMGHLLRNYDTLSAAYKALDDDFRDRLNESQHEIQMELVQIKMHLLRSGNVESMAIIDPKPKRLRSM